MKKLQEINRLVEEALSNLNYHDERFKLILTTLARKCAEINDEDFYDCFNMTGITFKNYNSRLRDGQVEEPKQEEKPALQPLPEEVPEWFNTFNGAYLKYNEIRQHFGIKPREWWQNLKKGDKFMFDNGVDHDEKTFRGVIYLAADQPEICDLSKCSPYTDPTQSFRSKLTPEMQAEFDKVIETINNK